MNSRKVIQNLKSSIKKHYVRKADFESLVKEVTQQKKIIAKLKKRCESVSTNEIASEIKTKKIGKKTTQDKPSSEPVKPQDKLTRIKGIGPVLEGKLHSLGIIHLSQIAEWSEQDIDNVSEHLSFKGRIEREEWVKQAKDLM